MHFTDPNSSLFFLCLWSKFRTEIINSTLEIKSTHCSFIVGQYFFFYLIEHWLKLFVRSRTNQYLTRTIVSRSTGVFREMKHTNAMKYPHSHICITGVSCAVCFVFLLERLCVKCSSDDLNTFNSTTALKLLLHEEQFTPRHSCLLSAPNWC